MTNLIHLNFCGDCVNLAEFQQHLEQSPLGQSITIDLLNEGPSLSAAGITNIINSWLTSRQQSPQTVKLIRWHNPVEWVPYQHTIFKISHFFFMVKNYWQHHNCTLETQLQYQKLFGLFVGRLTTERSVILYQLMTTLSNNILPSLMNHNLPFQSLKNLAKWLPCHEHDAMFNWYQTYPVGSLDNKSVRDQFVTTASYIDTNISLLQHYQKFAIEIVCETFTLGDAFLPTEKTVRPLMAVKPIIVYGPKYYLARLRTLGFQTYHNIWDESYDLYEGPERWALMRRTIDTLCKLSVADQNDMLIRAYEIALHNRQRLSDICNNPSNLKTHDYKSI